ncbi:MAG TPA: alpha-L-rhamnosidase N-terminal domain-containing protein, partial [Bacteroidota bacterium]|nr:alpha-L-rhamnosidase N-terminal domain-containing protein [Bacteroidota bacterium]
MPGLTRRDFFTWMALGVPAAWMETGEGAPRVKSKPPAIPAGGGSPKELDLSPARWIWYPSGRTLPNTFVFFRKEFRLSAPVRRATGWICADSRYLLHVNGSRIQWGPAAGDPRWMEVDPLEIARELREGDNVLAATVLFYGHGDGTAPAGKPGFIFRLEVETSDGNLTEIVSDGSWLCQVARCWQPGHYKRWYLRSLQEEFDARAYPSGWDSPGFSPDAGWQGSMILPDSSAAATPISSAYTDYALDLRGDPAQCGLRARSIPLLRESMVPAGRLSSSFFVTWNVRPEEYFEFLTPGAYTVDAGEPSTAGGEHAW